MILQKSDPIKPWVKVLKNCGNHWNLGLKI